MSEEAVAATEVPVATTHVEADGPMSMTAALEAMRGVDLLPDGYSSPEAVAASLLAPERKEAAPPQEAAPEEGKTEPEPEPDVEIDLGFEGKGEEKPKEGEFDEAKFDAATDKEIAALDPKQQDAWKKIKTREKEAVKRAIAAEERAAKAAELEAKAKRAEELEAQVEKLTAADYTLKVEASDEYRQKVSTPRDEIVETLTSIHEQVGLDPKLMQEVIKAKTITERAALMETLVEQMDDKGLKDFAQEQVKDELKGAIRKWNQLNSDHERMLRDAKPEWEAIQRRREEESLKQTKERLQTVQDNLAQRWERFSKVLPVEGLDEARARSERIDIRDETPGNQAYAQYAGEALPLALKEIVSLRQKLSKYESGAAAARKASPNLSEGEGKPEAATATSQPKTFAEAMRAAGDLRM